MRDLFFLGCKHIPGTRVYFCIKLVVALQDEEIEPTRLGVSLTRTTLGEVPSRPISRFSRVADAKIWKFRTSSAFKFHASKKKVDQAEPSLWSTVSFLTTHLKNELVRNSRNCDSLAKRETDLGTSPSVVRLIPRRAGSISSLHEANTSTSLKFESKKPSVCNLKKKVPHSKRLVYESSKMKSQTEKAPGAKMVYFWTKKKLA